jgi:hypothetical protein
MRLFLPLLSLAILVGPCCAAAIADGGQVRANEKHGEFQITVFTSPNPLRAGPIDVSVLIQDVETGIVHVDGTTTVELTSSDLTLPPIRAAATPEAATNKLLGAALFDLPAAGRWNARVEVTPHDESPISISFTVDAAPLLPSWLSIWPWFSWPFAVIALFVVHRGLVARRLSHRAMNVPATRHASHPSRAVVG